MRFKANIIEKISLKDGRGRIVLETDGHVIDRIDEDRVLVELKKWRNNRSIEQNRMMWALLELMGQAQGLNSWDCYIDMLEDHGARYEYLMVLPEAVEMVKEQFRATRQVETREYNGKDMAVLKCYYGSSKWNTAEMTEFIEKIMNRLSEMGVNYERDMFDW